MAEYPKTHNLPTDVSEMEEIAAEKPAGAQAVLTLENLVTFGNRHVEIAKEIETYEDMVAALETEQKKIEEVDLPTVFQTLGMEEFKLKDGTKIKMDKKFQGGIVVKVPERRDEQLAFLRENGAADIIKNEIICSFKPGKESEAEALKKLLTEFGFSFIIKQTVHAGTLGSTIKAMAEKAKEIPLEKLGWRLFDKAEVKQPGSKVKKRLKKDDDSDEE